MVAAVGGTTGTCGGAVEMDGQMGWRPVCRGEERMRVMCIRGRKILDILQGRKAVVGARETLN